MTQNPNWPLIDEAISWMSGPTAAAFPPYWVSIKKRTEGTSSHNHGKQYELDQYQSGRASTLVQNNDGAFDPANTSGPFSPNVLPYRAYRTRAQYPATVNLLTAAQATAGVQPNDADLTAVVPPALPYNTDKGGGPYTTISTAAGTYTSVLPGSPTSGQNVLRFGGVTVEPGAAYSAQVRVASTVSISMRLRIAWWNAAGALITTVLGAAVTVTTAVAVKVENAVPPAGTCGMTVELFINSSPGSGPTLTMDHPQVELAATASAYVQPNRWYPLAGMFAINYPQDWTDAGTYGRVAVGAVDIFGWLSQRKIYSPGYMEALVLKPDLFYALDEPSTSTVFQDATGKQVPVQWTNLYPSSAPNLGEYGAQIQALGTFPGGTGGPVAQILQTNGAPVVTQGLNLGAVGGIVPPASGAWSRCFAANPNLGGATLASNPTIWYTATTPVSNIGGSVPNFLEIFIWTTPGANYGRAVLSISVAGSSLVNIFISPNNVADGNWHFFGLSVSADGKTLISVVDDFTNTISSASDTHFDATGWTDVLAGVVIGGGMQFSCLSQWNTVALTVAQLLLLSQTFLNGGSVDVEGHYTSATRYADILRWANYQGASAIDQASSGTTTSYGVPSDLWATRDSQGTDVVTALQTVVNTENGTHFVSSASVVTFKNRRSRYNMDTPVVVFGENTGAGEIPYINMPLNYDPSRIANDAQFTATNSGQVTEVVNAASEAAYGDIPSQRSINTTDPLEVMAAGQFVTGRFGVPMRRIQAITIPASSFTIAGVPNGAAWLALLPLESGTRVRVMRRPPGAPVIQIEGFVESVNWGRDDKGLAKVDLQISPAQGLDYWQLSDTHTTLHTATIVGAVTATFDQLPDHATNAIQSNIPVNAEFATQNLYNWVIDWGLSTAEYFTMHVTPNNPGYTTWVASILQTVRLDTGATAGGFQFAHSIGAVIQDIGGYLAEAGNNLVTLATYLNPASALDSRSTLGTSTIVGY